MDNISADSPVMYGTVMDEKLASAITGSMRNCGGEWWINNASYVTHNGNIDYAGDRSTARGIRPVLMVKGINPDPRKNRKLCFDMPGKGRETFTYAGIRNRCCIYLCDRITGEGTYEEAVAAAGRLGGELKSLEAEFTADEKAPAYLPVLTEGDFNFDGYLPDDDRVCTDMSISDYDWMHYVLATRFPTKEYGEIKAIWEYNGTANSDVYVRQLGDDVERMYKLEIDSDVILKGFATFLRAWADQNDPEKKYEYAFNGGMEALSLWNETVSRCTVESYIEKDWGLPQRLSWTINQEELNMLEDMHKANIEDVQETEEIDR